MAVKDESMEAKHQYACCDRFSSREAFELGPSVQNTNVKTVWSRCQVKIWQGDERDPRGPTEMPCLTGYAIKIQYTRYVG